MKRTVIIASHLLGCVLVFVAGHTAQAAVMAQIAGTSTNAPSSATATPAVTETPSPSPSVTATTTLVPLPAITLIFPAPTETTTPTVTPLPVAGTQTPKPTDSATVSLSPRIRLLIGLIIVLWLFLAGFVIIYIRQFR